MQPFGNLPSHQVARETAETACGEKGMKLVAIETAAEQQQLAQHLEEAVKGKLLTYFERIK